jgi:hypothetical protein
MHPNPLVTSQKIRKRISLTLALLLNHRPGTCRSIIFYGKLLFDNVYLSHLSGGRLGRFAGSFRAFPARPVRYSRS